MTTLAGTLRDLRRYPTVAVGGVLIALVALAALLAPWIAGDPIVFEPVNRLKAPSAGRWLLRGIEITPPVPGPAEPLWQGLFITLAFDVSVPTRP